MHPRMNSLTFDLFASVCATSEPSSTLIVYRTHLRGVPCALRALVASRFNSLCLPLNGLPTRFISSLSTTVLL